MWFYLRPKRDMRAWLTDYDAALAKYHAALDDPENEHGVDDDTQYQFDEDMETLASRAAGIMRALT